MTPHRFMGVILLGIISSVAMAETAWVNPEKASEEVMLAQGGGDACAARRADCAAEAHACLSYCGDDYRCFTSCHDEYALCVTSCSEEQRPPTPRGAAPGVGRGTGSGQCRALCAANHTQCVAFCRGHPQCTSECATMQANCLARCQLTR